MKIDFENLINTRDLGGMKTKDGREIKKGMLIRSGQLSAASENDKKRLEDMLGLILDFRTTKETEEKPDPQLEGVKYIHHSIFRESSVGISRDKESDKSAFEQMAKDKGQQITTLERMRQTYKKFVAEPYINEKYIFFLDQVLNNENKAVLWHCTAGKDRAGFGAILMEYILGVSMEDMKADYLATNEFIKPEVEEILTVVLKDKTEEEKKDMIPFLSADPAYFDAIFETADEMYGSFDAFLEKALGVDEAKIKAFRDKFLA